MDLLTAAVAAAAGCAVGVLTGLVPGLHVNTLCAIALAAWPRLGPAGAIGLAATAVAHSIAAILPATYLGAPGEETLLSAMPAHRLLLEGRGPDAVRAALEGTFAGVVLSAALLLPYKWLLGEPGRLLDAVDRSMVWVLAAVLAYLALRDVRSGVRAVAWCMVLLALSGALGLVAGRTAVQALIAVPASVLLPLLSGLFGAPALLETLRSKPIVPPQEPESRPPRGVRRRSRSGMLAGVLASGVTAVLPGMTSAIAASAARAGRPERDPRPALATLAAIAGAQVVWGLAVLWLSQRARSGLAVAVQQAWPDTPWTLGAPPTALQWLLLAALASAAVAYVAVSAFGRVAARWAPRLSPVGLAVGALVLVLATVVLLCGWMGLAVFGVATSVGLLPLAAGRGRVQLTGCLLVPVLAYRLGWA